MPTWAADLVETLLGIGKDAADISIPQRAVRTVIVYGITLAIVRLGSRRMLSKASAFDYIVAIMLGSIMSSAVSGSAPFFATLAVGVLLLGLHWLFALIAFNTDWFGPIVKGERIELVRDGQVLPGGMRRAFVTEEDLLQAVHEVGKETDPAKVKRAYLERDGKISIIPYPPEPRVLSVPVENGVQTVRIELR